jgi:type IV pilus assembly protein PilV
MININKNIFFVRKMQQQHGMTFIEVLIALVIIVTGILGAVAMQATAKKGSFDAMQRSLASSLAEDIFSRMRANAPTLPVANALAVLATYSANDYGSGNYPEPAERCKTNTAVCGAAQILANDQFEWESALMGSNVTYAGNNVGGLIGATGCINVVGNNVTVVVSWQGRQEISDAARNVCGNAGTKRRQVILQGFII